MARSKNTATETEEKPLQSVFGVPESDLPGTSLDDDEDDHHEPETPLEEDIFDDYAASLIKKGDRVTFTIFKDGEVVGGSVKWPWNWDKTQQKWGGGTYKVLVRSSSAGRYVKGQVRTLAEVSQDDPVPASEETLRSDKSSTADLLLLLENMKKADREEARAREERLEAERREEKARLEAEARERAREAKENNNTTMMMFMKMMEQQSQQTTALLAAMMGGKKEEIKVEKIVEMMDARMEKMLDRLTGKDKNKDFDAFKLVELQQKAEDRGYTKAMDTIKFAEKKAEELAEIRERGGVVEPETRGTTQKLLESVMPAIQTVLAMRGGGQAPGEALASPVPTGAALPPPPANGLNPNKPALPFPGKPRIPALPFRPGQNPLTTKAPLAGAAKPGAPIVDAKAVIENLVIDEIGKDLQANFFTRNFQPVKTADKCLDLLKTKGIDVKRLPSLFTLDDMIVVAKKKGLPDAFNEYLEKFHAHVMERVKENSVADTQNAPTVEPGKPAEGSK